MNDVEEPERDEAAYWRAMYEAAMAAAKAGIQARKAAS